MSRARVAAAVPAALLPACGLAFFVLAGCSVSPEQRRIVLQEPESPHAYRLASSFSCSGGVVDFLQRVDTATGRNIISIHYQGSYFDGAQKLADRIVAIGGDELATAQIGLLHCPVSRNGNGLSAIAYVSSEGRIFFRVTEREVIID
jgi:hypothetical protein